MPALSRVILLEFNELTPHLIDRFITQGLLPNFKRLRDEAQVFVTDAGEEPPNLEPWIQWVTVHTGLTFAQHGVYNLDEGHTLTAKRLWDLVSDAGGTSWVCGSMNVNYAPGLRGALVPDPWCTKVPPTPDAFEPYFRFVQQNVAEYTNDRLPLSPADYARFVAFLATHGLSFDAGKDVLKQLLTERSDAAERWRRAVLLDRLQFDVFRAYFRTLRPDFSTFFINSTAHFQHSYWREMEPELFSAQPPDADRADHSDAIQFGYQKMDEIVGRFLELAGEDVTVILCTALSQQPCLKYEADGGAVFYRPRDFSALARAAKLAGLIGVAPVMTHQFQLEFATEADAIAAEAQLGHATVNGWHALEAKRTGTRIYTGCDVYRDIPAGATLTFGDGTTVPFFDLLYKLDTMKSGMHHPDGIFWVRTPARSHAIHAEHVPLTAVAPTIVQLLGLPPQATMPVAALPLG